MERAKYPVTSGHLVLKQNAYNTKRYFIKDLVSRNSGFGNEHIKNLLLLCNGTKTVKDIIDQLKKIYDDPYEKIIKKVHKSLEYLKKMGYIKLENEPKPRQVILRENSLEWSLDTVYLEVTHSCNLYCFHCYNKAGRKLKDEMDKESIFALINDLADLGVMELVLTGGEPLVREDIFEIMRYVKSKNIDFCLFTNGVLLNKEKVKKLKILNPKYISISLDSHNPEIHNRIRGQNCFSKVIKNIDILIEEKIPVRINTTIFKGLNDGQDQIANLISFLLSKSISQIVIGGFMNYGRGKRYEHFIPSPKLAKRISKIFKNKTKTMKRKKQVLPKLKFSDVEILEKKENFIPRTICEIGTSSCVIQANGDVALCPVLVGKKYCAGNIHERELKNIWINSKNFGHFRTHNVDNIHKCKKCSVKYTCLGGCKARSLMYNDGFDSPDPWMCSTYK
jgi:radical SAM protein with 4Fe4S-binding SPASM domain